MFFANTNNEDDTNKKEHASTSTSEAGKEEEEIESMIGSNNDFSLKGMSVYDKLGFEEDQIALGIDPDAVSTD